jgi:hypothetical protein
VPLANCLLRIYERRNSEGQVVDRLCKAANYHCHEENPKVHRVKRRESNLFKQVKKIEPRVVVEYFERVEYEAAVDNPHKVGHIIDLVITDNVVEAM